MDTDYRNEPRNLSSGSSSTSTDRRMDTSRLLSRSTTTANDFENLQHEPEECVQEHLLEITTANLKRFLRNKELMHRGVLQSIVDEVYAKEVEMIDQIREFVIEKHAELLREYAHASKTTVIDKLIDETFSQTTLKGLVDWISDASMRSNAMGLLQNMQCALKKKNGNDLRTNFDFLLAIYTNVLKVRMVLDNSYQGGPLGNRISADLKKYLITMQRYKTDTSDLAASPPSMGEGSKKDVHSSLGTDSQRLMGACHSIRNIGNWASHNIGPLSNFKLVELCGAIGALAETLPAVYEALKAYENEKSQGKGEAEDQCREKEAIPVAEARTPPVSASRQPSLADSQLNGISLQLAPSETVVHPLGFVGAVSSRPSTAPSGSRPNYRFYYERGEDIPSSDVFGKILFARMLNHMKLVGKANLCRAGRSCSDSNCKLSHTYMEVMMYNPLYKRIKCVQSDHYYGRDVRELDHCACVHVDTRLTWDWMKNEKRKLCESMERCSNSNCHMSHSVIEVCWYNPYFRTKECYYLPKCLRTKCSGYHDGKEKRELFREDDYVGIECKMLFPERTHQSLAMKLQQLEDM